MSKLKDPEFLGCPWTTWLSILIVAMMTIGLGLYIREDNERSLLQQQCNPKKEACDLIEYLEYYKNEPSPGDPIVAVGAVFRNGEPSHCIGGLCDYAKLYTGVAENHTPTTITRLSGCPDYEDGHEALDIIREWEGAGSIVNRFKIAMKGRA